jgi:hypothetical protein
MQIGNGAVPRQLKCFLTHSQNVECNESIENMAMLVTTLSDFGAILEAHILVPQSCHSLIPSSESMLLKIASASTTYHLL